MGSSHRSTRRQTPVRWPWASLFHRRLMMGRVLLLIPTIMGTVGQLLWARRARLMCQVSWLQRTKINLSTRSWSKKSKRQLTLRASSSNLKDSLTSVEKTTARSLARSVRIGRRPICLGKRLVNRRHASCKWATSSGTKTLGLLECRVSWPSSRQSS